MGWHAARKLRRAIDGLTRVLADRAPHRRPRARPAGAAATRRRPPRAVRDAVRAAGVAGPGPDRYLAPEIEAAVGARRRPAPLLDRHRATVLTAPTRSKEDTHGRRTTRPRPARHHADRPAAGRPRRRCGCCRTTSTPRSPSAPTTSSSTAAPAGPPATGAASTRSSARSPTLRRRRDDARAVRPAGRRAAHPRVGAAGADRQLQPGRRLGHLAGVPPARAARPDHVRPDDRRLVDLHRHPGHPAGHLRDVRRRRRQAVRRHAGRHAHPHRRLRRHGRRAAARGHAQRRRLPGRRRRRRPGCAAGSSTATSTRWPTTWTTPSRRCLAAKRGAARAVASGVVGNAADRASRAAAPRRRGRHRHRPDLGARPAELPARGRRPRRLARLRRRRSPRSSPTGRGSRWPSTSRRWSASWTPAPRCSTTATRSATRPARAATSGRSPSPASCPPTSGRCSARARARSAGPRSPATRPTSPPPTAPSSTCSPTTTTCSAGSAPRRSEVAFQGLPARICWLGYGERDRAGLRFNELVASGEISAPIVIGRDHLDSGSVASPYRETEAMADGSDAIADWPLLNALVNTAVGRHLGVDPPRRRRRHRPVDPRRPGQRRRRHRRWPRAEARAGADQRPGHGRASGTSTPATTRADEVADGARRPRPDARRADLPARPASTGMWADLAPVGRRRRAPAATAGSPGPRDGRRAARVVRAARPRRRGLDVVDRPGRQPVGLVGATRTPTARASSLGSHLDSVPGRRRVRRPARRRRRRSPRWTRCARAGLAPRRPLGVACFADEEGARFGVACAGSRLLTGALDADRARALTDADGVDDGRGDGRAPASTRPRSAGTTRRCAAIGTFVELHVEQGRGAGRPGRRRSAVGSAIWPHGRWRLDLPRPGRPRRHHPAGRPATTRCSAWPPPSLARPGRRRAARRARHRRQGARRAERGQRDPVAGHRLARRPRPGRGRRAARSSPTSARPPGADAGRGVVDAGRPPSTPRCATGWPALLGDAPGAAPPAPATTPGSSPPPASRPRCSSSATRPGSPTPPPSTPSEADCLAGVDALRPG